MAQQFDNEMTIYMWPFGNPNYRYGHAAYRIRYQGRVKIFNRDGDDHKHFSPGDYRAQMAHKKQLEQNQRSPQEQERLIHTAVTKAKFPIMPCAQILWGLPGAEWSTIELKQHQTMAQVTPSQVAQQLENMGADVFADPPYSTLQRWDVTFLERWCNAIRERIDRLNRKSKELELKLGLHYGVHHARRKKVTAVMSPEEWKELSKGGSFVRSPLIQKLDRLIVRANSTVHKIKIQVMAEMLEVVLQYLEESKTGTRSNAVFMLGEQILDVIAADAPHSAR